MSGTTDDRLAEEAGRVARHRDAAGDDAAAMKDRIFRAVLILAIFALIAGIGQYLRNRAYYSLVVADVAGGVTLTFLQPRSDPEACVGLAETIGSVMRANCPTCKVTRQECLRDLSIDLRDLLSEKPISVPSARISKAVIAYAHPNPETALATCQEAERQVAAGGQAIQGNCTPAGMSRPIPGAQSPLWEALQAGFGYLVQTMAVLTIGLTIFMAIQLFTVRSPTDALGVFPARETHFKMSNLAKRVTDVLASIILLALLFPILVLAAVLVFVLEGYPVFYVSRRYISLEQCVSILKFRTMVKDATSPKYRLKERFMRDGYLDIPLSCEVYTPLGRFLERTQLVEILQLFNILFHRMSLIGNRPLPRENIELLKQFQGWEGRFDSPAGITGLSQIVGKLNQTPQQRIELECLYSNLYRNKRGNVFLCDLLIAYYTIRLLLFGKALSVDGARQLAAIALGK